MCCILDSRGILRQTPGGVPRGISEWNSREIFKQNIQDFHKKILEKFLKESVEDIQGIHAAIKK